MDSAAKGLGISIAHALQYAKPKKAWCWLNVALNRVALTPMINLSIHDVTICKFSVWKNSGPYKKTSSTSKVALQFFPGISYQQSIDGRLIVCSKAVPLRTMILEYKHFGDNPKREDIFSRWNSESGVRREGGKKQIVWAILSLIHLVREHIYFEPQKMDWTNLYS